MSSIQVALQGLIRSGERLNQSAEKIAQGDISSESLVDFKISETDTRAQLKALQLISETEKSLLDIIA